MMKYVLVFLSGVIIGIVGAFFMSSNFTDDVQLSKSASRDSVFLEKQNTNIEQDNFCVPIGADSNDPITEVNLANNILPAVKKLVNQMNTGIDLLNNEDIFELTYLASKNSEVADLIKNKLVESDSLEEKSALLSLLSQNKPDDMIYLGIDIFQNADIKNKIMALELIDSIKLHDANLSISKTASQSLGYVLLEASYDDSEPEILSEVISQLTRFDLEPELKERVSEQFKYLTTSNDISIKVKAMDGLAQVGEPYIIQETIKDFLFETNEEIKLAAISAVFHLDADYIDDEIVSTLTRIIADSNESETARNIAAAALNSHQ